MALARAGVVTDRIPTGTPRKAAMDLLARREHSFLELQRKLSRRYPLPDVLGAVQRLAEEGLQSDERFAVSFSRERILRGQGPRRIEAELRQRGVAARLIDPAIAAAREEVGQSWSELATSALERKFGSVHATDLPGKARRARFLYQRGFIADEVIDID